MKMQVAKLVDVGRIDLFEEAIPVPGPRQLSVRIEAVGICGSDVHYFLDGGLGSHKSDLPLSMGHEPGGIVVEANGSSAFKTGDRVALEPGLACGECEYCRRGLHNLCQFGAFMGANGAPGAFREYMLAHESQLVKLEDWMTSEDGALLEPFGVAYHAVRMTRMHPGTKVAIFGAGPIGLSILIAAKLAGAGETFLIDKLPFRLTHARRVYAVEHTVADPEHDPVDYIRSATKGRGVDIAFDAAGVQHTVDACFLSVGRAGKVVLVGIPTYDMLMYNPHIARTKEVTVLNVRRSNQTLQQSVELLAARKMDLRKLVTHRFDIAHIQNAFELVSCYKDGVVKAVLTMDGVQ